MRQFGRLLALPYSTMNPYHCLNPVRRKAVWGPKRLASALLVTLACAAPNTAAAAQHYQEGARKKAGVPSESVKDYKLDDELSERAKDRNPTKTTRVIVTLAPGATLPAEFSRFIHYRNGKSGANANQNNDSDGNGNHDNGRLDLINGMVLDLPNGVLKVLASHPNTFRVHYDRPLRTENYRTSITIGARVIQQALGYTGAGIGVAVIDSGISTWHDDLTSTTSQLFPYGNQRVVKFVDFVNGRALPYDDNGHGTHVAGIIAGNGYDSKGEKAGVAPAASLISLKVLDQNGQGTISNIIAALGWIATNASTYNIRVVNMSVGAGVYESYRTDPLTLATKALTDKGITVVAAAGNLGKNALGSLQWGGVTAPGNAPWVLTVGASSTMGTLTRSDDTMAGYSSSGPTWKDFLAKPDLVAPGTGTVSLAVPGSTFYTTKAPYLLNGKLPLGSLPYLSLSGTSMAAPAVTGTIALMLEANPKLTPNLIKALLQYTAQEYPGYSALRQGAGFLNTLGAVRLAKYYNDPQEGQRMPMQKVWSRQIIWGNHRLRKGIIKPTANAWANNVVWGSAKILGATGDDIVWGTECGASACDNIVWGTAAADNIVWGTTAADNIVWGTSVLAGNIVWGTAAADNIVWGTSCGAADCDNIVWGTAAPGNVVWGTAAPGDNIVWGTSLADNIVWGTAAPPDVTWGSNSLDTVVYRDDATEPLPSIDLEFGDAVPLLPVAPAATPATPVVPDPTLPVVPAVPMGGI
jgi:serine protease AprX